MESAGPHIVNSVAHVSSNSLIIEFIPSPLGDTSLSRFLHVSGNSLIIEFIWNPLGHTLTRFLHTSPAIHCLLHRHCETQHWWLCSGLAVATYMLACRLHATHKTCPHYKCYRIPLILAHGAAGLNVVSQIVCVVVCAHNCYNMFVVFCGVGYVWVCARYGHYAMHCRRVRMRRYVWGMCAPFFAAFSMHTVGYVLVCAHASWVCAGYVRNGLDNGRVCACKRMYVQGMCGVCAELPFAPMVCALGCLMLLHGHGMWRVFKYGHWMCSDISNFSNLKNLKQIWQSKLYR